MSEAPAKTAPTTASAAQSSAGPSSSQPSDPKGQPKEKTSDKPKNRRRWKPKNPALTEGPVPSTPTNPNTNPNTNPTINPTTNEQSDQKPKSRSRRRRPKPPAASPSSSTVPPDDSATDPKPPKNNQKPKSIRDQKDRPQGKLTEQGEPSTVDKPKRTRNKKGPTLAAPDTHDLASSLAYELKTSTYECMVCWDVVRPAHTTWTCDCCWAVFHIHCVQKWATKSLSDQSTNKMITSWRCPGCQHTRTVIPKDYFCFCGKQRNPEPNKYLTPHSCGQLCKKTRSCPHPCVLPCHPGPCPPCTAMGPVLTCFCGRHTRQTRCVDTDYTTQAYRCEEVCGESLGCGKHECKETCHAGLCPPCTIEEVQLCYCGRHERIGRCGSGKAVEIKGHVGYYSCGDVCDSTYSCGIHRCEATCHPCEATPKKCPYDPSLVKTCPCGAESLALGIDKRTSCTDPIPTCGRICSKQLACGHKCEETCHIGECPPCKQVVQVPCRCQSTLFSATCADVCESAGGEPPECDRVCKSMRQCGRHQCGNKCCPAMKQKGKKKQGVADNIHECPLVCGRTLGCGIHTCQDKCHKGRCNPCLDATFDELSCHCGRTRLEPPIRCGTQIPPCPYPCQRPAPCGHMRLLQHTCHPDDEPCPPCSILISRTCMCGKTDLKNVPCYRESPRCGRICDKILDCHHRCNKTCHDGPCLTESESCQQPCDGTRSCGHPCKRKCHNGPCPETDICPGRVKASCECGQNSTEIPCHATADSSGSNHVLPCDSFCAKVQRNRKLALALDINREENTETLTTDDLGYYDDTLREFYRENPGWCRQVEGMLIDFCNSSRQTLNCKPMRSHFRKFIHRYAIHFNMTTMAVDPEPKRSVIVQKTVGQSRVPPVLLSRAAFEPSLGRMPTVEQVQLEAVKTSRQPVNSLYLTDLAFGLTKVELDVALLECCGLTKVASRWINDNDAVVIPISDNSVAMDEREDNVWKLKKVLKDNFVAKGICSRVDCCWLNQKGEVTWSEKPSTKREIVKESPSSRRSNNAFEALSNEDEEWMRVNTEQATRNAWEESEKKSSSSSSKDKAKETTSWDGQSTETSAENTSEEDHSNAPAHESSDDWEVVTG
ncbi:hypothetical protein CLU79DRAFT_739911 [Phycomyces nitens]|nr:hypothetical protein CLU79DRAFT_739911 [Phycomyces nitens]